MTDLEKNGGSFLSFCFNFFSEQIELIGSKKKEKRMAKDQSSSREMKSKKRSNEGEERERQNVKPLCRAKKGRANALFIFCRGGNVIQAAP